MHAALIATTALVFGVSLWATAWLARQRVGLRSSYGPGRQDGPVPGYTYYPAAAIDPARWMIVGGWNPVCLEAFHSPQRSRVVLTVTPRPGRSDSVDTPALLDAATRELLARSGAQVAVVEVAAAPEGPSRAGEWTAVASRDGRGWSGLDHGAWLVIEAPPRTGE